MGSLVVLGSAGVLPSLREAGVGPFGLMTPRSLASVVISTIMVCAGMIMDSGPDESLNMGCSEILLGHAN